MGAKTQLPTKYRTRKTTDAEDAAITKISQEKQIPYLLAKHQFFEALEGNVGPLETTAEKIAASVDLGERKVLSIGETKLGITMVLTKGDCKQLGFNMEMTTKEGIRQARAKLGLPEKPIKE